jgi:hypothetical protein
MSFDPALRPRDRHPRILVIRRDNIGDLVCTTPLLAALRARYPAGHVAALVNTYNRAVLDGNPDVDIVYAYEKGKHRSAGRSVVSVYADRARLILALRREKFDYAISRRPALRRSPGASPAWRARDTCSATRTPAERTLGWLSRCPAPAPRKRTVRWVFAC